MWSVETHFLKHQRILISIYCCRVSWVKIQEREENSVDESFDLTITTFERSLPVITLFIVLFIWSCPQVSFFAISNATLLPIIYLLKNFLENNFQRNKHCTASMTLQTWIWFWLIDVSSSHKRLLIWLINECLQFWHALEFLIGKSDSNQQKSNLIWHFYPNQNCKSVFNEKSCLCRIQ